MPAAESICIYPKLEPCFLRQIGNYLNTINELQKDKTTLKDQNEKLQKEINRLSNDVDSNTKTGLSKGLIQSKIKIENKSLKEEMIEMKKILDSYQKSLKIINNTNKSANDVATTLASYDHDLNEARKIMHDSINQIKTVLSGTEYDIRNTNYLDEGKTLEERFSFFFDRIVYFIEAIGEKKKDLAESYAKKLVRLSLACGIAGSILILAIRPLIVTILGFTGTALLIFFSRLFLSKAVSPVSSSRS